MKKTLPAASRRTPTSELSPTPIWNMIVPYALARFTVELAALALLSSVSNFVGVFHSAERILHILRDSHVVRARERC